MQLKDGGLWRATCFVDGEWIAADNGETIDVRNPADGSELGSVPRLGASETRRAIEAANRALPAWRARPAKERGEILKRWHGLMLEHQEDLARLMTSEQGKPLAEARGELMNAAAFLEWFAEEAKRA